MKIIHIVLGISLGTRRMGIAVLQGERIMNRKVAAFKGHWNDKKLHLILRRIDTEIRRYSVQAVSIKIPSVSHHNHALHALFTEIKNHCETQKIHLHICTIRELKSHGISEGRKNKQVLIQTLAAKYPSLQNRAKREQNSRNSYHTQMFEAIAAAELLQEQLQ